LIVVQLISEFNVCVASMIFLILLIKLVAFAVVYESFKSIILDNSNILLACSTQLFLSAIDVHVCNTLIYNSNYDLELLDSTGISRSLPPNIYFF